MNIFLTSSPDVSKAKAYLLRQIFTAAAKQHHLVETADQAEIAIVFGKTQTNLTALQGKKVYFVDVEQAFLAPEAVLGTALVEATTYTPTVQAEVAPIAAEKSVKNIVAVTACPTGVAHTFMSAEAIATYCQQQGWNVKVETRGQVGAGNIISAEDVAAADLVFIAADIEVDLAKFKGKPMYRTSTGLALKKTAQEFDKAFAEAKIYTGEKAAAKAENDATDGEKKGFYKHLMTGVSHMLPFVVAGGLIITIAWLIGGIYAGSPENAGTLSYELNKIGGVAFGLMIAAFSGYVAYSIADRPGLAVGFVGGMLAANAGAGILGGIFAGFLAGYIVKFLNEQIKLPASFNSLKPILILPLLGTIIVGLIMVYIINKPVAELMTALSQWLNTMSDSQAVILGAILGAMMCVDMGGPVNKAAYTFGTGMIATQVYMPMAAVMAAGMVPPIGMAIATVLARNKFTVHQRDTAKPAFVLGLCFISEGALPFVAADPIRVISTSVLGGATAGAISMLLGITLKSPHGGLFAIPAVSAPLMYLAAIAIGSVVTGVLYAVIKPKAA